MSYGGVEYISFGFLSRKSPSFFCFAAVSSSADVFRSWPSSRAFEFTSEPVDENNITSKRFFLNTFH